MARFTGSGSLTLNGPDARLYDFECQNSGGFIMDGNGQRLENCVMLAEVTVADGSQRAIIRGNRIAANSPDAIALLGNNDGTIIVNNQISTSSE